MTKKKTAPVLQDNPNTESECAKSTETEAESTPSLEEMIRAAELKAEEHHDA